MTARAAEFYERNLITAYLPDNIAPFINGRMLFNKHLGFKTAMGELRAKADKKFLAAEQQFFTTLAAAFEAGHLRPQCALRFVQADAKGDTLNLYSSEGGRVAFFALPRLADSTPACLADLVPQKASGQKTDIALFVTAAGHSYRAEAARLTEAGEYVASHTLNIAAMTCAEAMAEVAQQIAASTCASGFADFSAVMNLTAGHTDRLAELPPAVTGLRFSFGYPLCPDLSWQADLFRLLNPRDIGVTLTDGFMMEPETSVSGLIFPAAQRSAK